MKRSSVFTALFLFLLLLSCRQSTEENKSGSAGETMGNRTLKDELQGDSTEIIDDFAAQPFVFKDWGISLDSLLMYLPANPKLEVQAMPSPYYDNAFDTITKIRFGNSLLQHIRGPGISYLDYAIIADPELVFQREVRIGDSFHKITSAFPELKKENQNYGKVYIHSGEASSTVILVFSDNKLARIIYWPYTG